MTTVSLAKLKAELSRFVEWAAQGEEIVIEKDGRPVAKLVGFVGPAGRRKLGTARGQIVISDDFDAPLPEEIRKAFGE